MKMYLEYQAEKSHKFWHIEVKGNTFTTTYGKVGTNGQSNNKEFDDSTKAEKEAQKLIRQKMKKGYQEVVVHQEVLKKMELNEKLKAETKNIYLEGWEVRLNGDEQCQRFLQTQAIDKKTAKNVVYTELVFENNKLTKAFSNVKGSRKKRKLDANEVEMKYIDVKPHQMYEIDLTDSPSDSSLSYLGGDCPDTFKMSKLDIVAPFQYLGMFSNKEEAFRWLPFDLHLTAPIYLYSYKVFIDYSDPFKPTVIYEEGLKDWDNPYKVKSDSKIVFEKTPIATRKIEGYGNGIGHCGVPSWIQYPEIPTCPKSNKTMKFLAQIRSDIGVSTKQTNITSEETVFKGLNFCGHGDLFVFFEPESKVACYQIQAT